MLKAPVFHTFSLTILLLIHSAWTLDYRDYQEAMENGQAGNLTRFFRENQYRITNRETAYVVARHYFLHSASPQDGEALLPPYGLNVLENNLSARLKWQRGEVIEAQAQLQRSFLDSGNRFMAPVFGRIFFYLSKKDYAEARQYLLQIKKFFPLDPDILLIKAVVLFLAGDPVNAEIALNASPLFTDRPSDRARYFQLYALFLEGIGEIEKSLRYARLALSFQPADSVLHLKVRILETNSQVAPPWWQPDSFVRSPKITEDEDLRQEDFLTDRQIRDKLTSISKLIDQKNHPEAWTRLRELASLNSLLFERDILFQKSRIAFVMNRPDLAKKWLAEALKKPETSFTKNEPVKILQLKVEEAWRDFENEKKRLAEYKLSLPPADQILSLLEKSFPPSSLVPIPPDLQKYFFIDAPYKSLSTGSNHENSPGSVSSSSSEAKLPTLPPKVKTRYRNGLLTDQHHYFYNAAGQLTHESLRGPGQDSIQNTVFQYDNRGLLTKKIVLRENGLTNAVVEYQWDTSNSHPRTYTLQEGRLIEYTYWTNQGRITSLPGRDILQTESISRSNTNLYRKVSANGSLIWTEVSFFPDEKMREEELIRKELRSSRGDLIEYTLVERRQGRIHQERRFRGDHEELETTLFEW